MKTREGCKYVGPLPEGDWKLQPYDDCIIAVEPNHEPRIIKDEIVEVLKPALIEWP